MQVARDWPTGRFDLIVLSEVAYYFDEDALAALLDILTASLNIGGVLSACHWRHPVHDYSLKGDRVHEVIPATPRLALVSGYLDEDVRLEVFSTDPFESVARRGRLVSLVAAQRETHRGVVVDRPPHGAFSFAQLCRASFMAKHAC